MNKATNVYVLDTSAWLTLIEDEAGVDTVQDLLEKARASEVVVLVSFMSFMEVYYITLQERDADEALERVELMAALPVLRVESTRVLSVLAAELKAAHGKTNPRDPCSSVSRQDSQDYCLVLLLKGGCVWAFILSIL
jgi:predicted nucleic acid-binding protein